MSQRIDHRLAASIDETLSQFIQIRHDLHANPELAFDEHRTAAIVGDLLEGWGYEVHRGFSGTGVVASLTRGGGGRRLGIRADMDALPIVEENGISYRSKASGLMHACGHDGHTTILLCAAKHLAESGNFAGTVTLIFQPAEETGAGAAKMVEDGLFSQHPLDAIFGLHNWPNLEIGRFGFIAGPAMASSDTGVITITGKGGHGAVPHTTIDPIIAAASIVLTLQSVVSRNIDPQDVGVITIGAISGGSAGSIIPDEVELKFTVRAFKPEIRAALLSRLNEIVEMQAASFKCLAKVKIRHSVAPLVTNIELTEFAANVARKHFGDDSVETLKPFTGGEDFAYFLEKVPGSFVHVGNGLSENLHSPRYNFNDEALKPAALFWVALAEEFLRETPSAQLA